MIENYYNCIKTKIQNLYATFYYKKKTNKVIRKNY